MNGIEFAESGGGFNRVPGVCLLVPMPTSRPQQARNWVAEELAQAACSTETPEV